MKNLPRLRNLVAATVLSSLLCSASLAAAEPPAGQAEAAQADAATGVVNLNTATEAELTRLPGVGPKKAQAILALRAKVQRFQRIEAIMRVKGIGRKTFRKLRPMLAIEGDTTLAPQKPRPKAPK